MKIWKLWLPIFSLLIFFSVVELTFRFLIIHKDDNKTIAGIVESDVDLIWRLKHRLNGPLATNELGFRDNPYNINADYKILLLGDSVSWGDGVGMKQSYPFLLEEMLNKRYSEKTFEIINSAVPGYSTFQQLTYLKKYGLKLKPDIIIHQFCLNDIVQRFKVLFEYGGDNIYLGIDTRNSIQGFQGWMVNNSRAYETVIRYLINFQKNKQEYAVKNLSNNKLSPELMEAWKITLNEINEISLIAKKENIQYLLLVAPYRYQLKDPDNTNQPQVRLKGFAKKNNLVFYDLLDPFYLNQELYGVSLFDDSSHFSVKGHILTATYLQEQILNLLKTLN